ncbi:MAG: ribonuclease P protein component [Marinifilaceae bacterium]
MENTRFTFSKAERLTNKTLIEELFSDSNSFVTYPFRIVWKEAELPSNFPAQVAVSVSKRCFKRAVKRNLIKRRIREIYRLNKHPFYQELVKRNIQISFMIVYLPRTILPSAEMEPRLKAALQKIIREYEKRHPISTDSAD